MLNSRQSRTLAKLVCHKASKSSIFITNQISIGLTNK